MGGILSNSAESQSDASSTSEQESQDHELGNNRDVSVPMSEGICQPQEQPRSDTEQSRSPMSGS